MGANLRHLPEGKDFGADDFASQKGFGFSGSSQGYDEKGSASPPFAASKPTNNGPGIGAAQGHPMGHEVVNVTHDPESGAVVHHHAHGGYTMHHPDGGMTHHGADGQPAGGRGEGPGEGTYLSRAGGGKVEDDMGLYTDRGEPFNDMTQSASRMSKHEASGRQAGTEDYARIKRVQDSSVQPVRAIRKAADYVGEKYGDLRDSTSSALSGNPEAAEFRQGQRAIRKDVLGYAGGGKANKKPHHAPPKPPARDPSNTPPRNPARNPSRPNAMPGGQLPYGVQPSAEPDVAGTTQTGLGGALGPRR